MRNKPERMIGMKKFKKVIAMCLTAAMALSMMSIGAFANEITVEDSTIPVEFKAVEIMTPTQLLNIDPMSTKTGTILVKPNNAAGTNGTPGAQFTADADSVAFTITYLPGATNYNVALYQGTLSDVSNAVQIAPYETISVGSGYTAHGLQSGVSYFFKVSSDTLNVERGVNATYSLTTYSTK